MTEAKPTIKYREESSNITRAITCHRLRQQYEKAPWSGWLYQTRYRTTLTL